MGDPSSQTQQNDPSDSMYENLMKLLMSNLETQSSAVSLNFLKIKNMLSK